MEAADEVTVSPSSGSRTHPVLPRGAREADVAARKAFEKWSALPGSERAKYLFRIARIIQERSRDSSRWGGRRGDAAKPKETRDADLPLVAAHFFYYAGWADKLDHAGFGANPRPLGVAGQVIPWNFPLLMLAWKIAPALATGNTVVLKPAETTPLSALFFADICRQAGLPKGVVNILPGFGGAGAALVAHPDVNKVAFTGSTAVGKEIARTVAGTRKKVTLELGGKGANIVFDDAPVDQAVEGIVNGIFFNQGQVCCAGSRLLVQESIQDELLASLKRRLSTLRLGDPLDKNTDIGAINSEEQLTRITSLVEQGEAEGAERWSAACELPESGYWFAPTLFTNVTQAHTVARDEIFGPVLSVLTFRTPDEAVAKANNTPYGLSAGIWTEKGSPSWRSRTSSARASSGPTRSTSSTRPRRSAVTRSRASATRHGRAERHRTIRNTVSFHNAWSRFDPDGTCTDPAADTAAKALLDQLAWWGHALRTPSPSAATSHDRRGPPRGGHGLLHLRAPRRTGPAGSPALPARHPRPAARYRARHARRNRRRHRTAHHGRRPGRPGPPVLGDHGLPAHHRRHRAPLGELGDLYGHKYGYLTSITVFLIGSVLCGVAQDMGQLIAFRALQGIGAGGLFVGALALIGSLTPAEAGRAQSLIGVLLPAAMIGGPLVGGLLTDQLDWRWVFSSTFRSAPWRSHSSASGCGCAPPVPSRDRPRRRRPADRRDPRPDAARGVGRGRRTPGRHRRSSGSPWSPRSRWSPSYGSSGAPRIR
ncbi:NAD/NADP-dependent betaine aldehyde dehydrogenase [Streptomyces violarus]